MVSLYQNMKIFQRLRRVSELVGLEFIIVVIIDKRLLPDFYGLIKFENKKIYDKITRTPARLF